jgi:type II secretion system protein H
MNERGTRGRRRERSGFTLIEIMAVIAIIGMVFAIGLPRLNSSKIRALETEAESIAASLEFARQRAIMTGVPHRLLVDLEDGGYRIEWLVDEDRAFAAVRDDDFFDDDDLDQSLDGISADSEESIDFHPPTKASRDYYPIPSRQLGSFTWLDDARYFVGLDSSGGWIEGGDIEIVFDADGTTEFARLEIADDADNHLTLEIEPLFDRVRRRAGGARS